MAIDEYPSGAAFPGVVGRTTDESSPAWPQPVRARPGAPNVLMVVLDDTGFGQLGCYGSPIETPNFDALAADGLRYNNMHTTALCSPSRSCIVTGRNHHSNGMAAITELASGYPGYNGVIPFENGFLSEMLLEHGYNTFMVGKWHLTPSNQETAAGPYDRWPLARGFERFYGFLGGDTSQWYPDLVYDNHQVEPPATPEEGYHLTEDLVDKSIEFIADAKQVDPDKPFYLHLCFGATHAPHHVPKEWADKYAGQFDDGWDAYREQVFARQKELGIVPADAELSRHDPDVPDWDSLPEPARRLYSRMMEVFAGFLSHTDHHLGRLLDFLREQGQLDNTIVMVISDNGASAEGGPTGTTNEAQFFNNAQEPLEDSLAVIDEIGGPKHFNHYPWGWTWAGNTPFRRWKRETYRGGASDPFIVSWPPGIKARGEVRTQYAHIIDMVPTVLDLLGIEPPATIRGVTQSPLQGVSFAHTLDDADAAEPATTRSTSRCSATARSTTTAGGRSARGRARRSPRPASASGSRSRPRSSPSSTPTGWELYHVDEDFAENHNVAERAPRQAHRADRHLVRRGRQVRRPAGRRQRPGPHDRREAAGGRAARPLRLPARTPSRSRSSPARACSTGRTASPPASRSPTAAPRASCSARAPRPAATRCSSRTASCTTSTTTSAAACTGSPRPSRSRPARTSCASSSSRPAQPDLAHGRGAPGRLQLYVDGTLVADAEAPVTTPFVLNPGALTCGANPGSPVTPDYPLAVPVHRHAALGRRRRVR